MTTSTSTRNQPNRIETDEPAAGKQHTSSFEYAPAPEATDHIRIADSYDLFIGGNFCSAHSAKRFATINPATEATLSEIAQADDVDVDRAVASARQAFTKWSKLPGSVRARYLFRISRIIQER